MKKIKDLDGTINMTDNIMNIQNNIEDIALKKYLL